MIHKHNIKMEEFNKLKIKIKKPPNSLELRGLVSVGPPGLEPGTT
ncbi:MAG: hypothetical protein RL060_901 [Bacteroidota bacterium]